MEKEKVNVIFVEKVSQEDDSVVVFSKPIFEFELDPSILTQVKNNIFRNFGILMPEELMVLDLESNSVFLCMSSNWLDIPFVGTVGRPVKFKLPSERKVLLVNDHFDERRFPELKDFVVVRACMETVNIIREIPFNILVKGRFTPNLKEMEHVFAINTGRFGIDRNMKNAIRDHKYNVNYIKNIKDMIGTKVSLNYLTEKEEFAIQGLPEIYRVIAKARMCFWVKKDQRIRVDTTSKPVTKEEFTKVLFENFRFKLGVVGVFNLECFTFGRKIGLFCDAPSIQHCENELIMLGDDGPSLFIEFLNEFVKHGGLNLGKLGTRRSKPK